MISGISVGNRYSEKVMAAESRKSDPAVFSFQIAAEGQLALLSHRNRDQLFWCTVKGRQGFQRVVQKCELNASAL
jgi:hypothetical protein